MTARKMPSHFQVWSYWRHHENGNLAPRNKKTCFFCLYEAKTSNLERAHIVARCDGGPDSADNIVLLCHPCHVYTDGMSQKEWMQVLLSRVESVGYKPYELRGEKNV